MAVPDTREGSWGPASPHWFWFELRSFESNVAPYETTWRKSNIWGLLPMGIYMVKLEAAADEFGHFCLLVCLPLFILCE